jgi:antitoxin component YwqK of YwqJK toxin-antitoxin module
MGEASEPVATTAAFANGRRKYEGFLLDGEMHGAWTWWRTDGSMMRTGAFERGRQVGVWRTYDRAGNVVKETTFPDA